MLLITHGISTSVNIGKVIITENPVSLNLPMIMRTITLAWSCVKDQINYNNRVITKLDMDIYQEHLKLKQTLIVVADGVYYTSHYNRSEERRVGKEC